MVDATRLGRGGLSGRSRYGGRVGLPYSFTAARRTLEPRVFGVVPERLRREGNAGASRDHTVVSREVGEFLVGAVVTADEQQWPVTVFLAERWRVEPREIVVAALEAGRDRLGALTLRPVGEGVWRTTAAAQLPLLLRARTFPGGVALDGDPVLIAATSHTAFLAGADDLDGLTRAVTAATGVLTEHPLDAVSARALVRRTTWEPFAWPEGSGVRWRDRRAAIRLTAAVRQLDTAFAAACDLVRREGLPIRRYLGSTTTDAAVLDGWRRLATALGLDDGEAAEVRAAAADSLTFFDTHETELERAGLVVDRDEFRAVHALLAALADRGSALSVGRRSQPEYVASVAADSPAARTAGARITLAADHDNALELAEDVAARMDPFGVDVVVLGDPGSDLNLVLFPAARRADVAEAEKLIGDHGLVRWV